MNKLVAFLVVLIASISLSHGQEEGIFNRIKKKKSKADSTNTKANQDGHQFDRLALGLGLGLDYGGIGTSTLFYFNKHVASFVGAGYDLTGFGWNTGIKYRFFSNSRPWDFHPYVVAMYGVNSIFIIDNAPELDKSFNGATVGLGFEPRWKSHKLGYWSFGLLFPIESDDSKNYDEELEQVHGVISQSPRLPTEIRITVGYHFVLNSMR